MTIEEKITVRKENCIINHFQGNRCITTKTGILRSLSMYYKQTDSLCTSGSKQDMNNISHSEVLPTCFIITVGIEDNEFFHFVNRFNEIEKKFFVRERIPAKHCQDNWWLIKPANMNQGKGIKIYNTMKEITSFLAVQIPNSLWVVQKYIEKPLLYKDRKFDIRLWVLVLASGEIYYYRNSYVRTSSGKYDLSNTQDYITHLTNNCFQVLADSYGQHEEGNIISLKALEDYIKAIKDPSYNLEEHFFPWGVSHCVDVILSGKNRMKRIPTSYELFGFDLMIDEDLRVWLIECNVNPHLGTPNAMMKKIVPEMLNEMLTLTVDKVIPPKETPSNFEKGNWILCYSSAVKKRDHIGLKSFYPIKAFQVAKNNAGLGKRQTDDDGGSGTFLFNQRWR